jgi:ferrous iron transport protein B
MADFVIALAGNPNAGKSTIFNALTGSNQHVGNWPGKTVEKKVGCFFCNGVQVEVVDLPGTYSLSVYSLEEQVARDFIVKEKPALVVNVADAANLERNLYLTAQILETGVPLIVVLNMMDVARQRKLQVDPGKLSRALNGIPVVTTTASRRHGLDDVKQAILTYGTSNLQALAASTVQSPLQQTTNGRNGHGCPKCGL